MTLHEKLKALDDHLAKGLGMRAEDVARTMVREILAEALATEGENARLSELLRDAYEELRGERTDADDGPEWNDNDERHQR